MTPTEQQIADFQRDGALCLRGVVTSGEIAQLTKGVEQNLAELSPRAIEASKPDDPGRFVEDFCNWQRISEYKKYVHESPIAQVVGALMGSSSVRFYHDHLLVKEAGTQQPTPWHQDQPYYNVSGRHVVSAWIPLDPVPRASTLEVAAGSHLGEWLMPRTFLDRESKWFPEGSLQEIPEDPQPVLGWEVEPGDVVFFHALTLHRSAGATQRRRVLSLRFLGDDARHAPRRWVTSPPFPGLAAQLEEGAPMNHELFPVLWST
jgi:ectoine hydroxylase-related dioxygenase (phytanoyl-CoA dioxygenase family)